MATAFIIISSATMCAAMFPNSDGYHTSQFLD
jgi:hypothetical protein